MFNALNSLELKSLEEPRYLLGGKALFKSSLNGLKPCHAHAHAPLTVCNIDANILLGAASMARTRRKMPAHSSYMVSPTH